MKIEISTDNIPNAVKALQIIGGLTKPKNRFKGYAFQMRLDGRVVITDRFHLKTLRNRMCLDKKLTITQFHNLFEEALGLPLNSTLYEDIEVNQ